MRQRILYILKNTDGYVSGEEMSRKLSISRAAVWKHIKKLKNEGYGIESVTNRGYRLSFAPDIITESEIKNGLNTEFIGRTIFLYDETDTTNNRAKENSDAPDGSVFIAETQTGGKGSRGRGWVSPRGSGIWHTILLKPDISPLEVSQITLAAGLSVCKAIGLDAKIKWPNDIVIGSKKVCGILTEMSAEMDSVNYVVCGIGINVNIESFDDEISHRATSMYIESGQKYCRNEIISKLLNEFEYYYKLFLKNGLSALLDEYKKNCVTLGREVSVIFRKETVTGTAVDVDETGALVVETGNGVIRVNSGEVSVRGLYGYV
ncbi:MAG: biotin--[acetyl-CoA-carboxylase] ligase [Oscillospiraceae bacterium]|nr:biotin--[acetyl-CoA-carboxylase] ligase [Oscillospiraceae bacterium]